MPQSNNAIGTQKTGENEPSFLPFRGREQSATYRDTGIWRYRGNPLIEALPQVLTDKESSKLMACYPPYDESERKLPAEKRIQLTHSVLDLFIPLPDHTDLQQRFSCLVRNGYVPRDPTQTGHWQGINRQIKELQEEPRRLNPIRSAPSGFNIIGISGGGKTTGMDAVLNLYPQVIRHTEYMDNPFSFCQVVWLKLSCPFDGSIKALATGFFRAMDDLLGTNHYRNYAHGRTVDDMLPSMARVAAIHGLGVLIVDEIQHLHEGKSGGRDQMLNFFCELTNRIGLPVVFIGTFKALAVLGGEFRQIRRGCSEGEKRWERLTDTKTWKFFLESLWRYQYTVKPTSLTAELSNHFYDLTQGIPDLCVKLYYLAQIRAIRSQREEINEAIVTSVAQDSFVSARDVLEALRTNNTAQLELISDVHPIDLNTCLRAIDKTAESNSLLPLLNSKKANGPGSKSKKILSARAAEPKKKINSLSKADNILTNQQIQTSDLSVYEHLKAQGHIGSGAEFLEKATA